ncbi:MAG TPA: iron-containing alcohol dehydrogenase [Pirellula sp.]|nr:iron-containing alcohol dehydrogenase [Pirellula sp.]
MVVTQYNFPLTLIVGGGARKRLADQILKRGKRRVLVVTDVNLVASGKVQEFEFHLREAGIQGTIFSSVQPDPTVENVEQGLAAYRDSQSELIVGLGGGSPMDQQAYESKLQEMSRAAIESGSPANNPHVPTCEQIIEIYRAIW